MAKAVLLTACVQMLGIIWFGFVRSNPLLFNWLIMAVLAIVKPKLIRNWIETRFSFPNINLEMIVDKTNVHAKEKMKTARPMLLLSVVASKGLVVPSAVMIVDRAVWVKIW
jgi:hypothetical protein